MTTNTRLTAIENTLAALVAHLGIDDSASTTKASTGTKASTKVAKPAKARKTKAAKPVTKVTEARNERVTVVNGQKRLIVRENGKIVQNLPYGKKAKKAAEAKARQQAEVKAAGEFLKSSTRKAYIVAAMKQDEEYLEAIREHFDLGEVNPSARQCAFYALDVDLEVPGFQIGLGWRKLHAEQ